MQQNSRLTFSKNNPLFRFLLFVFFILLTSVSEMDAQDLVWAKSIKAPSVNTIKVDGSGNVYTYGYYTGLSDFDPGPGIFNLVANGNADIFVCKNDSNGNFVWAKSMGGIDAEVSTSMDIDVNGNFYLTGYYKGIADMDPGPGVFNLTSSGGNDIFVCKLDMNGNFIWAKSIGGNYQDYSKSLSVDDSGNVYYTGSFEISADFDPGPGVFNLTAIASPGGPQDIFIEKLDSAGNFVWVDQIGAEGSEQAECIVVDSGGVYITGYFSDTLDFDPGPGIFYINNLLNSTHCYVLKLNHAGGFIWAKTFEGNGTMIYNKFVLDAAHNVYVTGNFSGTVDFDPGPGTFLKTALQAYDFYIVKLNASGDFVWAQTIDGIVVNSTTALTLDTNGNIYATGSYVGSRDFDPGVDTFYLTAVSAQDIYILKLDNTGNFISAITFGGSGVDQGGAITTDINGKIYAAGIFEDVVDFDPGVGIYNLNAAANLNVFIIKLSQCKKTYDTIAPVVCKEYITPNANFTWTSSGVYTYIVPNVGGCDSVITVNLTVNNVNTAVTQHGDTLISDQNNATYQWLDCTNGNTPITGATSQIFTAPANGSYAVIVTDMNCSDTSDCISIYPAEMNNVLSCISVIVFPNPTTGKIIIQGTGMKRIIFCNTLGETLKSIEEVQYGCDFSEFADGFYLLRIETESGVGYKKLVIRK